MAKSWLARGRAEVMMSAASSLIQASTHHIYKSQMEFRWKFIKGKTEIWSKSDVIEVRA